MSVFECIWMYVSVCECILSVTSVFVCIWVYVSVMKVFYFILLPVNFTSVFEHIWMYLSVFGCIRVYVTVFECTWVNVSVGVFESYDCIWYTYIDTHIHSNTLKYTLIHSNTL